MIKKPSSSLGEGTPPAFPETTPPGSDMPAYGAQVLFEMSHSLGRIEGQLTSLARQVEDVDNRLVSFERHWNWITGGIAVAIVLIPMCAWIVWYALGDKIENALELNTSAIQLTPHN